MSRSVCNPWLHRFAVLTAIATLALVGLGGLVTSHNVGMAVPDWPTTYGYNMFLFPPARWVGGIFYEHTHRLLASLVGFLTAALAIWLWLKDSRPWLRWLGVAAFVLVVAQGVVGGLRVVLQMASLGILHAPLAQIFFTLTCAIALFTSRWWQDLAERVPQSMDRGCVRRLLMFGTLLIFVQLMLGATMRHQHAGLSIPDFPLAYHKLWPPTDPASVRFYNSQRIEVNDPNPITAFQIILQMVHRIVALFIFCVVALTAWLSRRNLGARHPLSKLSLLWLGLIFFQIFLGASTIWSHKAADVATAHVMTGALSLVLGALLTIVSFRVLIPVRVAARHGTETASSSVLTAKPAVTSAK